MTEAEAIAAAERVLALINSTPRTPPKEVIAAAIGFTRTVDYSSADAAVILEAALQAMQEAKARHRYRETYEADNLLRERWFRF